MLIELPPPAYYLTGRCLQMGPVNENHARAGPMHEYKDQCWAGISDVAWCLALGLASARQDLFLVPPPKKPFWAPLSLPDLKPLLVLNANKGPLSIPCKAMVAYIPRAPFPVLIPYLRSDSILLALSTSFP